MAAIGRPPKPVEVKRRLGNPGKRPLPKAAEVIRLPAATLADTPEKLGPAGRWIFEYVLRETHWIGATDVPMLELLGTLTDLQARLQDCDIPDASSIAKVAAQRRSVMSELGLSPTARSRLGLAEVRAASKLEELRAKRAGR